MKMVQGISSLSSFLIKTGFFTSVIITAESMNNEGFRSSLLTKSKKATQKSRPLRLGDVARFLRWLDGLLDFLLEILVVNVLQVVCNHFSRASFNLIAVHDAQKLAVFEKRN